MDTTNFVIDANISIEWAAMPVQSDLFSRFYIEMVTEEITVTAPIFILTETSNILVRKMHFSSNSVQNALQKLYESSLNFTEMHIEDVTNIADLAIKYGLTVYDAQYLFLANTLDCPLISYDKKLLALPNVMNLEQLYGE